MARRFLLEFEKPLVELENQIDQIRELARDSEVDVSQQLLQLETPVSYTHLTLPTT